MTETLLNIGKREDLPVIDKQRFIIRYREELLLIQEALLKQEQIELPVTHDFAPGLYLRSIFMPKNIFVIGKTHKTEHFNIVLSGAANIMINGEIQFIKAPYVFKSKAGVKKVLCILEDMTWVTTHPTNETDLDKLEKLYVLSLEEEKDLVNRELERLL